MEAGAGPVNGLRHLIELIESAPLAVVDEACACVARERDAVCVHVCQATHAVEVQEGPVEHGLAEALATMEHLASGGFG